MKYLTCVLLSITSSLIFGTYVGNQTLQLVNQRSASAMLIGCGMGIQWSKNYKSDLTFGEIAMCTVAAATYLDVLESNEKQ